LLMSIRIFCWVNDAWKLFFNWYGWGGVQLGPLSTAAEAYCARPGWLWWWGNWWNDDWQEKPKYSEKTCPSAWKLSVKTNTPN
jgi:hypothetical protein